ncbi:MAG: ATP-binding protein [Bernardetiaceae bacterium]|jgi:signal transduction histidine kinase|nr:ATP-binding protein [Bernardetiaceae bacterium]
MLRLTTLLGSLLWFLLFSLEGRAQPSSGLAKVVHWVRLEDEAGKPIPFKGRFSFTGHAQSFGNEGVTNANALRNQPWETANINLTTKIEEWQVLLPKGMKSCHVELLDEVPVSDNNGDLVYEIKEHRVAVEEGQNRRLIRIVLVPHRKISFLTTADQGNAQGWKRGRLSLTAGDQTFLGRIVDNRPPRTIFRLPLNLELAKQADKVKISYQLGQKVFPVVVDNLGAANRSLRIVNTTVRKIVFALPNEPEATADFRKTKIKVSNLLFDAPAVVDGRAVLQEPKVNFTVEEAKNISLAGFTVTKTNPLREGNVWVMEVSLNRAARRPELANQEPNNPRSNQAAEASNRPTDDTVAPLLANNETTPADLSNNRVSNSVRAANDLTVRLLRVEEQNRKLNEAFRRLENLVMKNLATNANTKNQLSTAFGEVRLTINSNDTELDRTKEQLKALLKAVEAEAANSPPALRDSVRRLINQVDSITQEKNRIIDERKRDAEEFRRTTLMGAFILVSLLVVATVYYLKERQIRKKNEEIARQNQEITRQNQEITRQNELLQEQQAEISQKNRYLQDLNQEKNNLMDIVAHDLKAPLNKMVGLTQLLPMEGDLSDGQREYVDIIRKSAIEGKRFIDDLLDINAIEQGQIQPLRTQPVDLAVFVPAALRTFNHEVGAKNMAIHFQNKAESGLVDTDQDYLRRIIDNLVSNAIKFSFHNTNIYVKLAETAHQVKLSVKDEGPGITEEDQKKLFKKFQRLGARPTGGESSTGIGLSIVKVLVERLQGHITVNSVVNKGTEFVVALPKQPVAEQLV